MDRKIIRVGMIGTGSMCKVHSNAYGAIPYLFCDNDFVPCKYALAGRNAEKTKRDAERLGYEHAVAGWEDLVEIPEVDLVDICVGDALHKETALEAIRRGKHVLCEKPLSDNVEDAREMYLAAEEAKVKAMCGFNYRFFPAVRLAKNLIDEKAIGRLYGFNGRYCQDSGAYEDTPLEKVWYAAGSKGSGVALGIGTHLIDMARMLMGEIVSVSGLKRTYNKTRMSANGLVGGLSRDEESLALLEFENGAIGDIKISGVAAGRKNQLAFEVSGSRGSIFYDIENPNILKVFLKDSVFPEVTGFTDINVTQADKNHPYTEYWWPRGRVVGWEDAHINEIQYLLSAISRDSELAPYGATFEDGYKAVLVCSSLFESAESGRKIYIEY